MPLIKSRNSLPVTIFSSYVRSRELTIKMEIQDVSLLISLLSHSNISADHWVDNRHTRLLGKSSFYEGVEKQIWRALFLIIPLQ